MAVVSYHERHLFWISIGFVRYTRKAVCVLACKSGSGDEFGVYRRPFTTINPRFFQTVFLTFFECSFLSRFGAAQRI